MFWQDRYFQSCHVQGKKVFQCRVGRVLFVRGRQMSYRISSGVLIGRFNDKVGGIALNFSMIYEVSRINIPLPSRVGGIHKLYGTTLLQYRCVSVGQHLFHITQRLHLVFYHLNVLVTVVQPLHPGKDRQQSQ